MMAKDYSAKGLIWPLFSTGVFYLVFVGALTLLFNWLEKKLGYFRLRRVNYGILGSTGIIEKLWRHPCAQGHLSHLEQGEALAIIGSSGCGKTTLLRCLNFLETPDTGVIRVNGETMWDAADPATQRESEVRKKRLHFGLVFQNFNLFPQYTRCRTLCWPGSCWQRKDRSIRPTKKRFMRSWKQQARALLAQMGLSERANHYPHQLSGGQQQRVAIARALALHPDILCFDEPTSALDPELTGEVLRVLRDLADRKTTMIIVTHEMHFARDVADRILFMDGGVVEKARPNSSSTTPRRSVPSSSWTVHLEGLVSPYAILVDADSGEAVAEKEADVSIYPASMTKVMTALLALEANPDLEQPVTLPEDIFPELRAEGASMAGFRPGEDGHRAGPVIRCAPALRRGVLRGAGRGK